MKKRALSLLMAVLMVVGLLPATARAVGGTENTDEVEIALKDCEKIGTCSDDPVYLYTSEIPKGKTTVSFVDFQEDENVIVATTVTGSYEMVSDYKAPITKAYAMDATHSNWKFDEGFQADDFVNCNAYGIIDGDGGLRYVVVQLPEDFYDVEVEADFTATVNGGAALTYTKTEDGYSYIDYTNKTTTVDLYTVQIPAGTTTVDLAYQTGHLTYNYHATGTNPAVANDVYPHSDYLCGAVSGDALYTGSKTASVPVDYSPADGESDGLIDYIQVQKPYNADNTGGELLYAITFEYVDVPFTATCDGSPLNITELNETGYKYSYGWPVVTADGPLYTVTVPKTAKSVELSFPDKQIVYNYNGSGSYLCDYSSVNWLTGTKELNGVLLDANGDGQLDYIQVQNPYADGGASGGEFVCAVKFVYPDGTTGTPSPVTPSGEVSFTDLINGIASSYAANGAGRGDNTAWITADMAIFADTYPATSYKFTKEQKQDIVNYLINATANENPKASDLAKSIIALISMGYDPNDLTSADGVTFSAVDKLVTMINDDSNTTVTNVYTLPFELIALKQYGNRYDGAVAKLRQSALDQAMENGGWGYVYEGNTYFDADATSFMLQALAPYYYNVKGFEDITSAINKSKGALIRNLTFNDSGAVVSYGSPSTESTAQLILALTAMGEDPKDNFLNKDLTKGLMSVADGSGKGFQYSGALNAISTEQGFRSMLAIANAESGTKYYFYDFDTDNLTSAASTTWAQNAAVSVKTIPEDAAVVVKSGETEVAADKVHGAYDLPAGAYTYTVSKDGYVTKTGSFTITAEQAAGHEKQTIHVSLVSAGSGSGSSSKEIKVTVKVMVPPKDKSKLYTYKHDAKVYTNLVSDDKNAVTVSSGTSVRDAMVSVLDANYISYNEESDGYFPTIGGWEETERGKNSGWMFMVNGSMSTVSAKDYDLTRNSTIVWFYTDDYTNDYGSESWSDGGSSSKPEENQTFPFLDVVDTSWYYAAVKYAYEHKLFGGTSATEFSPEATMTRGMAATILYSLEGSPAVSAKSPFSDVADGQWYAKAVTWAEENGIVGGIDSESFAPEAGVTREQLAAILYRYAQYKKYSVSVGEDTNILSYEDALQISPYAVSAIQWACGSGLMTGRTQTALAPVGTVTRAEVAVMLQRFCEKNIK